MNVRLVFHPEVRDEIDKSYRWHEQQCTGLGNDFLVAIEEMFDCLRQMPQIHQMIYRDVRRALPRRFPYGVYYRLRADRVECNCRPT